MVDSGDWVSYKELIMARLDEISIVRKDVVDLKIKLAVLSTKVVLLTCGVAVVVSAVATALANYLLKGGS